MKRFRARRRQVELAKSLVWLRALRQLPAEPARGYVVVGDSPHDPDAYTQGLVALGDGLLLEATGGHGTSSLRRVEISTGHVVYQRDVAAPYFGEGIAAIDGLVYELTWESEVALVWTLPEFTFARSIPYAGEGWGLCRYNDMLLKSDGTERLAVVEPRSFRVEEVVRVRMGGTPVTLLNDVEVMRGWILANVWGLERIAVIHPGTGVVEGWLDMSMLAPPPSPDDQNVLNGLAYDAAADVLYATGKLWPKVFALRLSF